MKGTRNVQPEKDPAPTTFTVLPEGVPVVQELANDTADPAKENVRVAADAKPVPPTVTVAFINPLVGESVIDQSVGDKDAVAFWPVDRSVASRLAASIGVPDASLNQQLNVPVEEVVTFVLLADAVPVGQPPNAEEMVWPTPPTENATGVPGWKALPFTSTTPPINVTLVEPVLMYAGVNVWIPGTVPMPVTVALA